MDARDIKASKNNKGVGSERLVCLCNTHRLSSEEILNEYSGWERSVGRGGQFSRLPYSSRETNGHLIPRSVSGQRNESVPRIYPLNFERFLV